MDGTETAYVTHRGVYQVTSLVLLVIVLVILAVVGIAMPVFWLPWLVYVYKDMGRELPKATQILIDCSRPLTAFLATGLLAAALILKEIFAAPKVRFWINLCALLALLAWGAFYFWVAHLPMWDMLRAMQAA
jgi:type II secretory pathway component PulF